ncbi:PAS domain S-box protein [bacterium]|nr:PAS domain S-box protein [bacterium]
MQTLIQNKTHRILIVDDEVIITTQLQDYFENMEYQVVGIANNGKEAIKMAREKKPDIILMDIVMPDSDLDGITAAGMIREELDIPVVFLTAYGGEKILERAKSVEPYGFVIKPFQGDELKAAIEVALYRKQAESQLKASEEQYRSVVDSATEAIITIDIKMRIIFWNRAAEMMFGYSQTEASGQHFTFLITERFRQTIINEMDRMVLTEESDYIGKTTETIAIRKDGTEFPMEFSLASWIIRDEIFFTIIARNITERKKVESMKSDFVSLVSHQLKTPVSGILGCIDNMLKGLTGKLSPQQIEYLRVMQDISKRNYRIISDLLNISRIERGVISMNIKPANLDEIVDLAVREHKDNIESKGLKLNIMKSDNHISVMADQDKMVEALNNVIHNAYKFTEKGSISIIVKRTREYGSVEIHDTGSGIPANQKNSLFQRKQIFKGAPSTHGGCGLGLYIAHQFMQLQKGNILVKSKVGKGATFIFEIPLSN